MRLTVAGHPVHPILIAFPMGALGFGWAMDVLNAVRPRASYRAASRYAHLFGAASAVAAGVTGLVDYLDIPSRSREKGVANTHALINGAMTALLAGRLKARSPLGALAWSTATMAALSVSGWYGGSLVYDHGVRVSPRSLARRRGPELKAPGDERVARALSHVADDYVTSRGPTFAR